MIYMWVFMSQCAYQRTILWGQLSPPTHAWVLGIDLTALGLHGKYLYSLCTITLALPRVFNFSVKIIFSL